MRLFDRMYSDIASVISRKSTCISQKVGAVIVRDDRIISHGYNGTPSGEKHCTEVGEEMGWIVGGILVDRESHSAWSEVNEIHAEQNAICYAAKSGISTRDSTMYVTISPCHTCCKLIVAAGIKTIVVSKVYDRAPANWKDWLIKKGVNVIMSNENEYK